LIVDPIHEVRAVGWMIQSVSSRQINAAAALLLLLLLLMTEEKYVRCIRGCCIM
jgi:hypothetical protein